MKKPTKPSPISMQTIERDLKALFETGDCPNPNIDLGDLAPTIDLDGAMQLFDHLRAGTGAPKAETNDSTWSHPSVLRLAAPDPPLEIIQRTRRVVLDAIEKGWSGPPYNPFTLAEIQGIRVVPSGHVLDARTRSDSKGFTIEFNPERPSARMRYSIAHEIGHTLFPDCAAETRNRATHQEMKDDDWQLESLCNIAAAEILMPFGTLQEQLSIRPSVGLILELRQKYSVSCEAVVNRLVRLTSYPCLAFLARIDTAGRHFVEYPVVSPTLGKAPPIRRGYVLPRSSEASKCTAIGVRTQEDARWVSGARPWFIEYVGISPHPGEIYPRVLAMAYPPLVKDFTADDPLTFMSGDASEPFGADPKLLLQVVNDQAQVWGGGLAKQTRKKWPKAQASFREWTLGRSNLKLGNLHSVRVRPDLTLVSLIAQHRFGAAKSGPRLRYGALFCALEKVAELARAHPASVHMPRIGTGEAGGIWNIVEGMIRETLTARGIKVTVYDLPSRTHDVAIQSSFNFPRELVDELV